MKRKNTFFNPLTFCIVLAIPLTIFALKETHVFQPKASERVLSYRTPFTCTACKADITRDGYVNGGDTSKLAGCFGKRAVDVDARGVSCSAADIDGDGFINETDRSCIQSQFLQTCSAPSPSPTPNLTTCTACAADLNKDGVVNGADASTLSVCWGKPSSSRGSNGAVCATYDIDKNGIVNEGDLSCISAQMLKSCTR